MLLAITTTYRPARDLGYLLGKHPDRAQSFELSFGRAHVFYPEATAERCTTAMLLDIDPVGLVRGRGSGQGVTLGHYVNDRPYVSSSFMSVAIAQVYRSALSGRCKERPELAQTAIPLRARLAVLPCRRGGDELLRKLFEPLGYSVTAEQHALDEQFPEWGESPYFTVTLEANCRLSELLSHLYVLVPALDDEKHYWVGDDEVEKLLRHGVGWLESHPERELITRRYLKRLSGLAHQALDRLLEEDQPGRGPDVADDLHAGEASIVEGLGLNEQRLEAVLDVLQSSGAKRVLDLGCGGGRLLEKLLCDDAFEEIVGVDVSYRALQRARKRLHWERLSSRQRGRVRLLQGSLTYRDERLAGYEAAAAVEVIEHLDEWRLAAFERVLFEIARPKTLVITTPNAEYNVRFNLLPGGFRHSDHRFEWSREEFREWSKRVAERYGYSVRFLPVGPEDPEVGAPTQMGVFSREPEPEPE